VTKGNKQSLGVGSQKDLFFIDANIYLDFYGSSNPKQEALLLALDDIRAAVFVTHQIRDEVIRNRANVVSRLLDEFKKKIVMPETRLPAHLLPKSAEVIERWNSEYKNVRDDGDRGLPGRLGRIRDEIVEAVVSGSDAVSSKLQVLFDGAREHSEQQAQRARCRMERGNPPGKPSDPLGDQLSWEQLLDAYDPGDRLWLISKDYDYFVALARKEVELSPFLAEEVRVKSAERRGGSSSPDVRCFIDLGDALDLYKELTGKPGLVVPSDAELPRHTVSVDEYHQSTSPSGMLPYVLPEIPGDFQSNCPRCGGTLGGSRRTASSGRVSWNLRCHQCGSSFIRP